MSWLVKTEPSTYSFDDLLADGSTVWEGVRSPAAVAHLRSMRKGEAVVVYHTGSVRAAVGLAVVAEGARPDPADPRSALVTLKAVARLPRQVPLAELKERPEFERSPLVTIGRLSVLPLTAPQLRFLKGR